MSSWLNDSVPFHHNHHDLPSNHFPVDYYSGDISGASATTTTVSPVEFGWDSLVYYYETKYAQNETTGYNESSSVIVNSALTTDLISFAASSTESQILFPEYSQNNNPGLDFEIFDKKNLRHNLGWTITLIIAYVLILVIGIIGNFMVILVVVFRPQMRTVTNMFIMNLACADLFVIIFCVPATLLSNILTRKYCYDFYLRRMEHIA